MSRRDVRRCPGVPAGNEARYADRHFEMEAHVLRLGLGQGEVVSHAVTGVEAGSDDGSRRYRVHYREPDGGESVLSFDFDGKGIRFANQPEIVWQRDPAEVRP